MKLLQSLLSRFQRRNNPFSHFRIVTREAGFSIFDDDTESFSISWSDIEEIVAFKEDFWAYDEMCLGIRSNRSENYVKITESFIGYKNFLETLEDHFAEIRKNWFIEVAFPAFAFNRTTLWKRSIQENTGLTRRCS